MPTPSRFPSMPEYRVWSIDQLHDETAYLRHRTAILEAEIAARRDHPLSARVLARDEHAAWPGAA